MKTRRHTRVARSGSLWLLLAAGVLAGAAGIPVPADAVEFAPLVRLMRPTCLMALEDRVYGGSEDGGVVVWDAVDPDRYDRWYAGPDLSSGVITELGWSGTALWVATADGGLTRVIDPAGSPSFRQYATSLEGVHVTAVTGRTDAGRESVWYGLAGAGLGEIIDSLPGVVYTAATDGLIDDNINALVVQGDALYVGTPSGISRFAGGVFTDFSAGLANSDVRAFAVGADGTLYSGGAGGFHHWDEGSGAWVNLGDFGLPVVDLAVVGDALYVFGKVGASTGLRVWQADVLSTVALPSTGVATDIAGGDDFWVGTRLVEDGMNTARSGRLVLARLESGGDYTVWIPPAPVVGKVNGVTVDTAGRPWLGSNRGLGLSAANADGSWLDVYEIADVDNDFSGLIDHTSAVFFMATGVDGAVWAGQRGAGLLRHDPSTGRTDPVVPGNSGLGGTWVENATVHPDGPLIITFSENESVEVLVEPDDWADPDHWITLPPGPPGTAAAEVVRGAYVERRDVVWFSAKDVGLVRWDINGLNNGPDDEITWYDQGDDYWAPVITAFPDTAAAYRPQDSRAFAPGPDGTFWVGGSGLLRVRYDERFAELDVFEIIDQRTDPQDVGLVNSLVQDLAMDRWGNLWVASLTGLNRVRAGRGSDRIDAWLDPLNYAGNPEYRQIYPASALAPLGGTRYERIVADAAGEHLVLSADRGAVVITADAATGASADVGGAFLYPNPWDPADGLLHLGGVDAGSQEPARVTVYSLEGEIIRTYAQVFAGEGFWDGRNFNLSPVATGMYVVRVEWRGATQARTLAIVR